MIVALSTQVYGSDNNYNSGQSDFQKIQCYREITSDSKINYEGKPIKCKPFPIKWISSDEFIELGNQSWNNNDLERKKVYDAVIYKYIVPDYLTLKISQSIKYDAQTKMDKSVYVLKNIRSLLFEKLPFNERRSAYLSNQDLDIPDRLNFERSTIILHDAINRREESQCCLENITELLAEKEFLHNLIELKIMLDLIELKDEIISKFTKKVWQ